MTIPRPAPLLLLVACAAEPDDEVGVIGPPHELRGPLRCDAPDARTERVLDRVEIPWELGDFRGTYGAAVADFDGDGHPDVVLPTGGPTLWLPGSPRGPGVAYRDVLPALADGKRAAVAGDLDGDGRLDLYLSAIAGDVVVLNRGDGAWEAVPAPYDRGSLSAALADVDGDGDLDVATAGGPGLLINEGDGATYTLGHARLPSVWHQGTTFIVGAVDLDGDLDLELYRVNDILSRKGNLLAWNRHGRVELDEARAGLDLNICGMGLGLGDINGDGVPDLAMSDCEDLWLLESHDGLWVDHSLTRGLATDPGALQVVPWGVDLADLDNDGDLDVVAGFGPAPDVDWITPARQLDAIYLQGPDGRFAEVATDWGMDDLGNTRGFVLADLNDDGFLDLVKQDLAAPPRVFLQRCDDSAWLRIGLDQPGPNPDAIGARVEVRAGEQRWTRWMLAGGHSLSSGGPPEVHVGLGSRRFVDVTVTWPDGASHTWQRVPTRHVVTLTRP